MTKYLIDRKGDKGLYFIPDNGFKFVVANIGDDNGIGNEVDYWSRGNYYGRLSDALKDFNREAR